MNSSIIHCENEFEYARSVSKKTLEIINNKLKQSDVCNVAVSGGSSPLPVYDYLVNNKGSFDTDWSKVNFFFIDGSVYINSINFIKKYKSLIVKGKTKFFKNNNDYAIDIDYPEDLVFAKYRIEKKIK